ncbi:MAG: radical SAM family heme chaperone HemW [Alphaproteobacteria bacterium]
MTCTICFRLYNTHEMTNTAHHIYIHVPFCMSKCNYCAFFSHACTSPDWDKYTSDICNEIILWGNKLGKIDIPTVFFGGGTPSLMPVTTFETIIQTIKKTFNLLPNAEITLESNPKTLNKNKLTDFFNCGMNRLSIGIQSLDDEKLKFLGRRHSVDDALQLLDDANNIGLRLSADFIYGLPNENVEDIIKTCNHINQLGLKHCSLYELTIEPGTPFGKMNLNMPDNDTMAQMYVAIGNTLKLPRYEVSNYATDDQHCMHNESIWDGKPYIGIGLGAAGRIYHENNWYEQLGAGKKFEKISNNIRATEMIITGMRTKQGCQLTDDIKKVTNIDWIKSNHHLVQIKNNRIFATNDGILILDDILVNMVK